MPSPLEFTIGHNLNTKGEVDIVMNQVEKAGVKIIKPAQDKFYGSYTSFFRDLEVHLLEVAWNPAFEINE